MYFSPPMNKKGLAIGWLLFMLAALGLVAVIANAQMDRIPPHPKPTSYDVQLVGITDPAFTQLENEWNHGTGAIEHAFCGTEFWFTEIRGEQKEYAADYEWRIVQVERAQESGNRDDRIGDIECPMHAPILHTHPPDCDKAVPSGRLVNCVPNCQPTKADYELLESFQSPFGVIQCGEKTFVPYYPRIKRPPNFVPPTTKPKRKVIPPVSSARAYMSPS